MKKILYPVLALAIFVCSAFITISLNNDYTIKNGYSIAFKSKDPSGDFTKIKGSIQFDENDLASSKFDITIDVNSINTGNSMQNKKAQTSEWFNAAKYPKIQYVSNKVEKSGADFLITGKLTMKGITKDKKITVKASKSNNELSFSGKFTVNRIEYGVGQKSDAVPDIMNISFLIPVTEK